MTWCSALLIASATSDFGDNLIAALDGRARPPSRLNARWSSSSVHVYEGWRSAEIAHVLDECAETEGEIWLRKAERFDVSGRRVILAYGKPGDGRIAYRRRHKDRWNAQSNLRMRQWRDSLRPEWEAYRAAYGQRFPGCRPMGFGRWLRFGRVSWLKSGVDSIEFCESNGLPELIRRDFLDRQDRRSSASSGGAV